MSDAPILVLLAVLAFTVAGTCSYVAANGDALERGVDVPERMEGE